MDHVLLWISGWSSSKPTASFVLHCLIAYRMSSLFISGSSSVWMLSRLVVYPSSLKSSFTKFFQVCYFSSTSIICLLGSSNWICCCLRFGVFVNFWFSYKCEWSMTTMVILLLKFFAFPLKNSSFASLIFDRISFCISIYLSFILL